MVPHTHEHSKWQWQMANGNGKWQMANKNKQITNNPEAQRKVKQAHTQQHAAACCVESLCGKRGGVSKKIRIWCGGVVCGVCWLLLVLVACCCCLHIYILYLANHQTPNTKPKSSTKHRTRSPPAAFGESRFGF